MFFTYWACLKLFTYTLGGFCSSGRRNDWCFLCEFQSHVERASQSLCPFSPINILSRLPNIGGNLGYGRQEDAHEFMRYGPYSFMIVLLEIILIIIICPNWVGRYKNLSAILHSSLGIIIITIIIIIFISWSIKRNSIRKKKLNENKVLSLECYILHQVELFKGLIQDYFTVFLQVCNWHNAVSVPWWIWWRKIHSS